MKTEAIDHCRQHWTSTYHNNIMISSVNLKPLYTFEPKLYWIFESHEAYWVDSQSHCRWQIFTLVLLLVSAVWVGYGSCRIGLIHSLVRWSRRPFNQGLVLLPRDAAQSVVLLQQIVCPSLRDVEVPCSHKIILWLVSLGCSLSADSNIMHLLQGEHLKILAGIGMGWGKKWLWVCKRTKVTTETDRKYYCTIYALTIGAKINNQWPWMTLKGHMHSVSKQVCHNVVIYLFLVSHPVCF